VVTDLAEFLEEQAADCKVGWSVGTFGAIAEFTRDADEPVALDRDDGTVSAVTARGALRIVRHPELRPIASESPTTESWTHRIALCLPETACAMSGRNELTEVGPDREALREQDRGGVLFDLGLGALQSDFYVRSSDAAVVAALRACAGKSVFSLNSGAMKVILAANPHRVFVSRLGRIEVYQPIPPAGGKSPTGPHTHVLPKLLAHGRTHSANEPLPAGWIPCAHCYPPHPLRDGRGRGHPFRRGHHDAFQAILARYGIADLIELKRRVIASVMAGRGPDAVSIADDRFARATVRVALRQLQAADELTRPATGWFSAYDRLDSGEEDNPLETPH
jgi:hypothetical protein